MIVKTALRGGLTRGIALALLLGVASITFVSCDKNDKNTTGETLSPTQQIEQGWSYFELGDYTAALQEFSAAIDANASLADAWNGQGWALGRIPGRLNESPAKFAKALQLDTTRYDAIGGWAFAIYQLGGSSNWESAINKSDSLLHRRPGWRFLHEATLNELDVQLLKAASYYNLGDFSSSLAVVVEHLNTTFEADVSTATGRRELLEEIERLRLVNG